MNHDLLIFCVDLIRGFTPSEPSENANALETLSPTKDKRSKSVSFSDSKPSTVVVVEENINLSSIILVAVDAPDRPGLLLDISKSLLKLHLQLHHTEASVQLQRSMSVWRCEPIKGYDIDLEEIWTVLNHVLLEDGGQEMKAIKKRGLQVLRAKITEHSRLIGKQVKDVNFRLTYKAAIVSVIKGGSNITTEAISDVEFAVGDVLILQANNDSPLLTLPDDDFYTKVARNKKYSFGNLVTNFVKHVSSGNELTKMARNASSEKLGRLSRSPSREKIVNKLTRSRSNSGERLRSRSNSGERLATELDIHGKIVGENGASNGSFLESDRKYSDDYGGFVDIEESGSRSPKEGVMVCFGYLTLPSLKHLTITLKFI